MGISKIPMNWYKAKEKQMQFCQGPPSISRTFNQRSGDRKFEYWIYVTSPKPKRGLPFVGLAGSYKHPHHDLLALPDP